MEFSISFALFLSILDFPGVFSKPPNLPHEQVSETQVVSRELQTVSNHSVLGDSFYVDQSILCSCF